jgi:hypothetical protein
VKEKKTAKQPQATTDINWLVKDKLVEYALKYPPVASHLEMNIDRCIYSEDGTGLYTYSEMWMMYSEHLAHLRDPSQGSAHPSIYEIVRKWLCQQSERISSSAMKRFRQYIVDQLAKQQSVVST